LIKRWVVRGKELIKLQKGQDATDALLALVSSLEEFMT